MTPKEAVDYIEHYGWSTTRLGLGVIHPAKPLAGYLLYEPPVPQNEKPVGKCCEVVEPMLRHHHGLALGLPEREDLCKLLDSRPVQIGGGLIQHHDLRLGYGDGRTGHLLLFSPGEGEDTAVHERLHMHLPGHPADIPSDLVGRRAEVFRGKGQLAGGVHVEELAAGILEHAAHMGREVSKFVPPCVVEYFENKFIKKG